MAHEIHPTKIVCVGRNYLAHARELGNDVPSEPLLFFKPPSALIGAGEPIVLPHQSQQVEHEAEIGVVIKSRARRVSERAALGHVSGFVPVNDVTARDLQRSDNQWVRAKGFDTFCPVGTLTPIDTAPPLEELEVICRMNGVEVQHGRASDMAFTIPFIISYVSHILTLEPGDLIATGTPEGVSRLSPGDHVEVEVPGVGSISNPCVAES